MPNLSHATIMGHLGRDPESRMTNSGTKIVSFSLAATTGYGDNKRTTWWNVSCFGKTGEAAEKYLKKGNACTVLGEPSLRLWKDKDGNERQSLELRVDKMVLMDKAEFQAEGPDVGDAVSADCPF